MKGNDTERDTADACKFIDVLTCDMTGDAIGYAIGGTRPGPDALVCGDIALVAALADRLLDLPTLGWIRGRLILLDLCGINSKDTAALMRLLPDVTSAQEIMLPYRAAAHTGCVIEGYWTTLRLMHSLGMIEGRGVPLRVREYTGVGLASV